MRVVSLACSNTEIVCALGLGEHLVGVDDHSDRPAETLRGLPRVGPDLDIDVARVAELEPDLVLASLTVPGHERVVAALEEAGLELLVLEPESLADVLRDVRRVAAALGAKERGARLAEELGAAFRREQPLARRPRILVQWWNRPTIAPGGRSWVTQMLRRAGGENPLGREDHRSRPVPDEEVAALDPDAIVLSWCGVAPERYRPEVVLRNPAWQGVRAVREGLVFGVPEAHLGRPGPGLVAGLEALREIARRAARSPSGG